MKAQRGRRGYTTSVWPQRYMRMSSQSHAPAALTLGKCTAWVGPRNGLDRFGKGKTCARARVWTPDRPVRSKSLYRLSYPNTYVLTPCSRVLLEKLTGPQLVNKFPAFYGTRRFITAFTSSRNLSLPCATSFQSMPTHHFSWRSILILSSIYAKVFRVVYFPQVSPLYVIFLEDLF